MSATGQVIFLFIIYSNKKHLDSFYDSNGIYEEEATFAILNSRYMDDELSLSYLINHFDKYIILQGTAQIVVVQIAVQIVV